MSMTHLTILQFLWAFGAYFLTTVGLPAFAFSKKFKRLGLVERFLAYFTIGNFYVINLVYILELMHLSYPITLFLGTLIPVLIAGCVFHGVSVKSVVLKAFITFKRLLQGQMGLRLFWRRCRQKMARGLMASLRWSKENILKKWLDWLLLLILLALSFWLFGSNMLKNYGYMASDLPVHNWWINYMGKNQIFVDGIYPFGFHCILYYLHELFFIDTYVLLRIFCLAQFIFVGAMLLLLLKYCCKSRYIPYLAVGLYICANFLAYNTYSRFYATLPQEFGMAFIYPTVYFAFAYFKQQKLELQAMGLVKKTKKKKNKKAKRNLQKTKRKRFKKKTKASVDKQITERKERRLEEQAQTKERPEAQIEKQTAQQTKEQAEAQRGERTANRIKAQARLKVETKEQTPLDNSIVSGEESKGKALSKQSRKNRKRQKIKGHWRRCLSTWYLAGFAMSFAMTLTVHFYGTMIAGLFCVGIAAGYLFRVFKKPYLGKILLTGILSVFIAVLPMGIAFAMGTPLQGSLGWGMSVITGGDKQEEEDAQEDSESDQLEQDSQTDSMSTVSGFAATSASGQGLTISGGAIAGQGKTVSGAAIISGGALTKENGAVSGAAQRLTIIKRHGPVLVKPGISQCYEGLDLKINYTFGYLRRHYKDIAQSVFEKIVQAVKKVALEIRYAIRLNVISNDNIWFIRAIFGIFGFLFIASFVFFIAQKPADGAQLLSIAVYMLVMSFLLAAGRLGIPQLMDPARCSIYYAYMLPLAFALCLDAMIYMLLGWLKWKWVRNLASLACVGCAAYLLIANHMIREIPKMEAGGLEMNEAVTCLTNIINEEKDFKWTICSANDELRMGEDHGYHYETIEFLRMMERLGPYTMVTMPTETVYFFIEKVPLDYMVAYENSGQKISRKGAQRALPGGGGLSPYQGENRWIVMSRMYYWALEFQRMYPNEMKVYLETEQFVCYKVKQNTYRLFNFAIDYGYNELYREGGETEVEE